MNELSTDLELLGDFIVEAREHLGAVELQLVALDQNPGQMEVVHAIFRGFHSIKGLAGFLGLEIVQEVAHEVETVLDLVRQGTIRITPVHIDVVLASKDYLNRWLMELEKFHGGGKMSEIARDADLLASIRALTTQSEAAQSSDPVPAALNALGKAQDTAEAAPGKKDARSIKVDTRKLDLLVDMVGEMLIAQSLIQHDPDLSIDGKPKLARNLTQLARTTGDLQRTAMSMRMVPIGQLFQKMSRLVRDLSRKTGKQVELEMIGEDTELDRNIVEELADPLMHMVRNAIDHGIELPEARARAGKNPNAKVTLKAACQAGYILIEVRDDGRGLDREKILRKARERGLPADGDPFQLIFSPGFSTADQVTEVSGRGVGMDVVKKQIQKLRGKIDVKSTPGEGSTFMLKLPLTLAIIDGLLVGVGTETYIVPIFAVREIFKPSAGQLSTLENRDEMVLIRGSLLPIIRLHRKFGVQPKSEDLCGGLLIVAEIEAKRFCLFVDDLHGKQEVVIKSLGETMRGIAGISGCAILGDGRVGLILDPEGLFSQRA